MDPTAIAPPTSPPTKEELAYGLAGLDARPQEEAAGPAKKPRFINAAHTDVELADPLEFEGVGYHHIRVINPTIGLMRDYYDNNNGRSDRILSMPIFETEDGRVVPNTVMEAISMRDGSALIEAAEGFLSRKSPASPTATDTSHNGEAPPPT